MDGFVFVLVLFGLGIIVLIVWILELVLGSKAKAMIVEGLVIVFSLGPAYFGSELGVVLSFVFTCCLLISLLRILNAAGKGDEDVS